MAEFGAAPNEQERPPASPKNRDMKAMILAAGEGTRLRPLTLAVPKPMVPIANTPLLERTMGLLAAQGVREIAVNLFHRPEVIRAALGSGETPGVALHISHEERLMGTAGGVKRMEAFLDETFLVIYGDNLIHADFAPLLAFHRQKRAVATIATFRASNPSACGLVVTDADGRVTRFQEKPPPDQVFTDTANAGVYVLEPEIFGHIPPDTVVDFGTDVFPSLLNRGIIFACALNGYLQDTGTPESYRRANWDALEGKAGGSAAANGLLVGAGTRLGKNVSFAGRCIVGANCTLQSGAFLADTIVWEGCRVGVGARIAGAILGRGVIIGDGAVIGEDALLGDGARVADRAHVPPGARIGPGASVA